MGFEFSFKEISDASEVCQFSLKGMYKGLQDKFEQLLEGLGEQERQLFFVSPRHFQLL